MQQLHRVEWRHSRNIKVAESERTPVTHHETLSGEGAKILRILVGVSEMVLVHGVLAESDA